MHRANVFLYMFVMTGNASNRKLVPGRACLFVARNLAQCTMFGMLFMRTLLYTEKRVTFLWNEYYICRSLREALIARNIDWHMWALFKNYNQQQQKQIIRLHLIGSKFDSTSSQFDQIYFKTPSAVYIRSYIVIKPHWFQYSFAFSQRCYSWCQTCSHIYHQHHWQRIERRTMCGSNI